MDKFCKPYLEHFFILFPLMQQCYFFLQFLPFCGATFHRLTILWDFLNKVSMTKKCF